MTDERLEADEVVRRLGGSASWPQILRYSTNASVRRAVATGALRRVGRGVYSLPGTPLPYPAATAARGLVSHQSAAQHWKLETLTPDTSAHVTVPRHARPQPVRGVKLHFSDVPGQDDHSGVTSPLRTVLDCAVTLPFAEALSIADSSLRLGILTSDELIDAAVAKQGAGRARMIRVAGAADARAANPFESGLRAIVLDAGLTGFEPQLPVQLPSRTAWVDLGDPDLQIALEADSFTFHGSPEALRRDCQRYDELIQVGWLPLRFGYEHVTLESAWLKAVVADTCALRPGRRKRTRPK